MMNERANWDLKFLGKIRSDGNISIVKDGKTMRFYLDIDSNPPTNLPDDATKYLTCFSEELENLGFIDDPSLMDEERKELLKFCTGCTNNSLQFKTFQNHKRTQTLSY